MAKKKTNNKNRSGIMAGMNGYFSFLGRSKWLFTNALINTKRFASQFDSTNTFLSLDQKKKNIPAKNPRIDNIYVKQHDYHEL